MSFDISSLIEVGKVVGFVILLLFLVFTSLWMQYKFPCEYGDKHIDLFDYWKDLKNGKNNTNAVLGSSESTREGRKSRAGSEEEM